MERTRFPSAEAEGFTTASAPGRGGGLRLRVFDPIDQRFDAMEERLIRIEVLAEERHHQMRLVAQQLVGLQETMTREFKAIRSEMAEEFGAVCSELRSVRPGKAASLDAQGRLLRVLGNRVGPLKA